MAEEVLDLVVDVDERLGAAAFLVRLVDDVVAERGGDDVGDLALLHLEGGLVELGNHHAAAEPAERTAFAARRAVGVLLGLFCEIAAGDDALADGADLLERRGLGFGKVAFFGLDEDVLAEDLRRDDVLGLVGLVECRDVRLGRIVDVRAGLVDEPVDAGAFLEFLTEAFLGDALGGERLLVVLFAADLGDDLGDLGVDVGRRDGQLELGGAVEEELCADGLLKGLLLELRKVLLDLLDAHAVAHVEPHETVEFEIDGFLADFLSVDDCFLHQMSFVD